MAGPVVEVRYRITGGSRGAEPRDPILLELLTEHLTAADLIRQAVSAQIRELLVQRRLDKARVREVLDRQYLTNEEIARQTDRGAVRYPSERRYEVPHIDAEQEVQRALRAFEAQVYFVLVNGEQVERLDQELHLGPMDKVTFLRLMPMTGG